MSVQGLHRVRFIEEPDVPDDFGLPDHILSRLAPHMVALSNPPDAVGPPGSCGITTQMVRSA